MSLASLLVDLYISYSDEATTDTTDDNKVRLPSLPCELPYASQ